MHDVYRGKDYMRKFYESIGENAMTIINFFKKEMKLLTKDQHELYENAKIYYICQEKFKNKYLENKNVVK